MADPRGRGLTDREALVTPGWEETHRDWRVPTGFRAGRTLYLSGHTGGYEDGTSPEDPRDQIRLAFEDLTRSLEAAGATWADVVSANSYHVRLRDHADAFLEIHHEFVQEPYPAWTGVGVTELFSEGAIIEIAVTAVLPNEP